MILVHTLPVLCSLNLLKSFPVYFIIQLYFDPRRGRSEVIAINIAEKKQNEQSSIEPLLSHASFHAIQRYTVVYEKIVCPIGHESIEKVNGANVVVAIIVFDTLELEADPGVSTTVQILQLGKPSFLSAILGGRKLTINSIQ
jgi:hypothetical protein